MICGDLRAARDGDVVRDRRDDAVEELRIRASRASVLWMRTNFAAPAGYCAASASSERPSMVSAASSRWPTMSR